MIGLFLFVIFLISLEKIDVFGHGNPGVDRSPPIDFENKNVTVEARMSPSDITVGDISNAFVEITFLNEDNGIL